MSGNCLKASRPLLSFDSMFDQKPHLKLIKNTLLQVSLFYLWVLVPTYRLIHVNVCHEPLSCFFASAGILLSFYFNLVSRMCSPLLHLLLWFRSSPPRTSIRGRSPSSTTSSRSPCLPMGRSGSATSRSSTTPSHSKRLVGGLATFFCHLLIFLD